MTLHLPEHCVIVTSTGYRYIEFRHSSSLGVFALPYYDNSLSLESELERQIRLDRWYDTIIANHGPVQP